MIQFHFLIGTDYVLFSSNRIGTIGGYDLVLGNIHTGQIWFLNELGVNSELHELGTTYTSATLPTRLDQTTSLSFEVYPNPTSSKIFVRTKDSTDLIIQNLALYDLIGNKIKDFPDIPNQIENIEIDCSSLKPGLYILSIQSLNGKIIKKVVKVGSKN